MACESAGQDKNSITITVIVLGMALFTVMMAYLAFGEETRNGVTEYEHAATLRMVAIIFRHGERSPTELYPNDPHINYHWQGGFGSLTLNGSLQMYNLGRTLNIRYKRLLPLDGLYSKEDIYVLSSAAERCLMSAQSFLAGLLQPSKTFLPIPWQPVAVNSLPRDRDNLLAQKMACPRYDELLKEMYKNPKDQILEINKQNAQLYMFLSGKTGKNVSNVAHVEQLYNTLDIESKSGLDLPEWAKDVFPQKMLSLAERNLALLTETLFMKRVKGGALISEVINKMILKTTESLKPDRSTFIYSGHDVTLVNVMRALQIIEQTSKKPDYGATLAIELHNIQYSNDFTIKIFYYANSKTSVPQEIKIPNCSPECSLTEFRASVEDIFLQNYIESCQL